MFGSRGLRVLDERIGEARPQADQGWRWHVGEY